MHSVIIHFETLVVIYSVTEPMTHCVPTKVIMDCQCKSTTVTYFVIQPYL